MLLPYCEKLSRDRVGAKKIETISFIFLRLINLVIILGLLLGIARASKIGRIFSQRTTKLLFYIILCLSVGQASTPVYFFCL